MPATPEVPKWQIFASGGGHFRWALAGGLPDLAGGEPDRRPPETSKTLTSRLPSMADLLLLAPPKLRESDVGSSFRTDSLPMFRTGSGKSVSVSDSSMQKARSVLEGCSAVDRGAPEAVKNGDGDGTGFPMFRTGSGKTVTLKQSSMRKAASVLGEDEEKEGAETVVKDGCSNDGFPVFHTASGKSVTVKQSSVRKATAVLGGGIPEKEFLKPPHCGSNTYDVPMFQKGSGKSVFLKQSSIKRAISVLQDEDHMPADKTCKLVDDQQHTFSNSLFQTGSGKAVNISSAGLSTATTLLGLDGADKLSDSKYFESVFDQYDTDLTTKRVARWSVHSSTGATNNINPPDVHSVKRNSTEVSRDSYTSGNQSYKDGAQDHFLSGICKSDAGQPPFKFSTAGGKSLSISSDALERARSLLAESELGSLKTVIKVNQSSFLREDEKYFDEETWNKENTSLACPHQNMDKNNHTSKLLPPVPPSTNQSMGSLPDKMKANYLLPDHHSRKNVHFIEPYKQDHVTHDVSDSFRRLADNCHSVGPLADVSNTIHTQNANMNRLGNEKKRLPRRISISPFKRPRVSRFTTPIKNISSLSSDTTKLSGSEKCCLRNRVSTHYPPKICRKTLKEFFGGPPTKHGLLSQLLDRVKHMNPDNAETFRFSDTTGSDGVGPENFLNMLVLSGASLSSASKEWVANHYKWIVWKLACLERCYPGHASGKFLTAFNVLEELKYRYEREVNYGHRSAIKRILDGDSSPASMMVLCISSIYPCSAPAISELHDSTNLVEHCKKLGSLVNGAECSHATKVELTDGWYSLEATLDVLLTKQLAAGKLFVGQKLRIWGASLCGWVGPISPLEASRTVSLLIHMNGTYRARWSDPLGFCKVLGDPVAFRCIKGSGGKVPRTLVGVSRIYPVLYKERLHDGGSIVRSERMEKKIIQLFSQRRSNMIEDIISEQHDVSVNSNDSEEGARIFRILEASAEPEVLMADMSSEQLMSFSSYQSKQEEIRQCSMQKKIEKALEDAGLSSRNVTPFMRVKVVDLIVKGSCRRGSPREGLITIWSPTDKQKLDLVEGQIYSVSGLMPLNFGSDILYLQARGSSTIWKPMPSISEKFEPFFTPRKPVHMSNLGEVPLASEFDIAAVVVHVGEVYTSDCQKKQWIFVTDGSICSSKLSFEACDCLLAISFCSSVDDDNSFGLLSHSFARTTVSFCNLVKRARDQTNHLWVAEATENSTYSVCYNLPKGCHLKVAADSAKQWASESSSTIQKLQERVLCVIGGHRN